MTFKRTLMTLVTAVLLVGGMVASSQSEAAASHLDSIGGVTYAIVDTGQSTCYNATSAIGAPSPGETFYGQDAQYHGRQPSYTTSDDGLTVLDNNTGLTWIQSPDTNGDGVIDSNDKLSWAELPTYVETLNARSFGGYSDWRVPSIKELYSLMDFRGTDPSGPNPTNLVPFVDTAYFAFGYGDEAAGERLIDAQYWSSTEHVSTTMDGNATVFGVNFADGRIKGYPRDKAAGGGVARHYIRLVRGNPAYGVNELVASGHGTVTDNATGLMWQQADSGAGMTWGDALNYCENLDLAGATDWHLPNAKELQSIVDYTRSPDTTGSAAIDPLFSCTRISNEKLEDDYPFYWSSTTHARASQEQAGSAAAYVAFGRGMGYMMDSWLDVHGAGCQRSDPKEGELSDYAYVPYGYYNSQAPQGDAIRIDNFVRCVRDAEADAVAEFTTFVEIVVANKGLGGSQWKTDLVVMNQGQKDAKIELILHTTAGDFAKSNEIAAGGEGVFEDVVSLLGYAGKGLLELRTSEPVVAIARVYNQTADGTCGQLLEGHAAGDGLAAGESAMLLGLRQMSGRFRTNISVSNTGSTPVEATVELFTASGEKIHQFTLGVEPYAVVQDIQPFAARAGRPDLGWGFARVTVTSGSGVLTSASVIDAGTGDATTIPMKR
ncbi:MAG: DUF1566 domain-containing protein [Acidobacteria bacterium]|nr:DUF1566 domain-containing protein [Acidobacteriota bacterium]